MKVTFLHQLARLLCIEKIYRAFTIIKGKPYHHD
ncbi:MAG: 23S rRNA (pseudouridine(1915)-N(3))-methyltransferase RlmH [Bacteroidales bacterium]|nr:23S rRNA (pseudouridine(1915)-N(3))-methyltransferase RlmH [Bacteroidales bacterium]